MLKPLVGEALLGQTAFDLKRCMMIIERLPQWSLSFIASVSEACGGHTPSMSLFRDMAYLWEPRVRASSSQGLTTESQIGIYMLLDGRTSGRLMDWPVDKS